MNLVRQIHLIKRALKQSGQSCVFARQGENEFHEPSGDVTVLKCNGLFHEANGFLNVSLADAGKVYTQREPKLLIMYADVRKEDQVTVNKAKYKVIGTDDLGNLHLCLDLSLEAV